MAYKLKLGDFTCTRLCKTKGCSAKLRGTNVYYCRACRYNHRMKKKEEEKKLPEQTCHICDKKENAHHYGRSKWMCSTCSDVKSYIRGEIGLGFSGKKVPTYEDYGVEITWAVDATSHDGYCSDPGEIMTKSYTETEIVPLVKAITESDLDKDKTSISSRKIELYNAYRGCGVCGTGTSFTVLTNRIVKLEKRGDNFRLT